MFLKTIYFLHGLDKGKTSFENDIALTHIVLPAAIKTNRENVDNNSMVFEIRLQALVRRWLNVFLIFFCDK